MYCHSSLSLKEAWTAVKSPKSSRIGRFRSQAFWASLSCSPRKRDPGSSVFVEIEFASGFDASFIVIAHDHGSTQATNHLEAFSGVRAVADNVAQADHLLDPFRRDIRQDSFQSLEIAVDVGENGELHEIASSRITCHAARSSTVRPLELSDAGDIR